MTTELTTIAEETQGRSYPLPHPSNRLRVDVERLRTSLQMIDIDVTALRARAQELELLIADTLEEHSAELNKKALSDLSNVLDHVVAEKAVLGGATATLATKALNNVTAADMKAAVEGSGAKLGLTAAQVRAQLFAFGDFSINYIGKR